MIGEKSSLASKNYKLTEEEVKHVARLSNLSLNSQEIKKFQKQLSEVLNYIDFLKKVKTKKVEPTSQVTGLENVFRPDKPGLSLSPEEVLKNAPKKNQNLFMIKAIFKK